jgi:hypothetical protein
MRLVRSLLACGLALGLLACASAVADEKKADKKTEDRPTTLTGTLVCGKCTLKETEDCSNVLQVKEDGKTVNYYLKDKGKGEKYHRDVCPPGKMKEVTVSGTVMEEDGKKWIVNPQVAVK